MRRMPLSMIAMLLFAVAVYMMITIVPQGNNHKSLQVGNGFPLPDAFNNRSYTVSAVEPSVLLNNYDNWLGPMIWLSDYQQKVAIVAKMDRVCMTEHYSELGQLTPQMLKSMHSDMKVFRLYTLCCKIGWDTDWNNPQDTSRMQIPITKAEIGINDWWLRDGNGDIVKESDIHWMIDVGKPGFKEAFLEATLNRMDGQGYDGLVFDYLWPDMITSWITSKGHPAPSAYPNDYAWYTKAWQPFFQYVMAGLHDAGYIVIGNCAGEYRTLNQLQLWQRTQVDGTIYEQWCVGWTGEWLPGKVIEDRIIAYRDDPLEAWNTDFGLQGTDPNYQQKVQMALAMHYIAKPSAAGTRFHYSCNDMNVFWEPVWDLNIGTPSTAASQPYYGDNPNSPTTRRYFWLRNYTNGLVLMNYNTNPNGIKYNLSRKYRDLTGKIIYGRIVIPPHKALILQRYR